MTDQPSETITATQLSQYAATAAQIFAIIQAVLAAYTANSQPHPEHTAAVTNVLSSLTEAALHLQDLQEVIVDTHGTEGNR